MKMPGITVTIDKVPAIEKAIKDLAATRVMVGIPASKAARREKGAINNAALGYIHENGAPEAGIPARPFLIPGVRNAEAQITAHLKAAGEAALSGEAKRSDRELHATGLIAQAAVRAKITAGPFIALARSTLARRRARGRTGTKPLIDSGQLRNAISYVLRRGVK